MKAIVTGGAGFIGSTLVDSLIDKGYEVVVLDDLSTGNMDNVNSKATFVECDISKTVEYDGIDYAATKHFEGADVVFHTAALARVQPSILNPIKYNDVNVNGTLNLLVQCVKHKIKKFVFSSSSSVYGNPKILPTPETHSLNPMSPYALHKQIGEQYCKLFSDLHDISTVSLRYFNVYGDRQPTSGAYCLVMGIFAQQMKNGQKLTINGDGEQRRDFTYVKDVVAANIAASKLDCKNEIFNIGAGNNKSVNHIAQLFGGDAVHNDPVIEPNETLADNSKAKELLGFKPFDDFDGWCKNWIKKM